MSAARPDRPPSRRLLALLVVLAVLLLILVLRWAWPDAAPSPSASPTSTRPDRTRPTLGAPLPEAPDDPSLAGLSRLERLWLAPFSSVVIEQLANGLTVMVVPRPDADRVAVRVVVRAGATEDEVPGVAHLLEHLLFRGTPALGTEDWAAESAALDDVDRLLAALADAPDDERRASALRKAEQRAARPVISGESAKTLAALGASKINGTTTHDATTYQMVLPADVLDRWARFELDRFSGPAFRQFRTERRIVVREIELRRDHAGSDARGVLRALLYPTDPYGTSVGGTPESVGEALPDDARAFFDDWYVPRNMAVVVAGPVDPAAVITLVAETLGTLPDHPAPPRSRVPLRTGRGDGAAEGLLDHFGWVLPPSTPEERAALEVASALVAQQLDSEPAWLSPTISVRPTARSTEVLGTGRCLPSRRSACRPSLRQAVERTAATHAPACVLAGAAAEARTAALAELEGVEGHADAVARAWIRGESLPDLRATMLAYGRVDAEAVRAAAARLEPGRLAWVEATESPTREPSYATEPGGRPRGEGPSDMYRILTSDLPAPTLAPAPVVHEGEQGAIVLAENTIDSRYRAELHFAGGWLADPLRCRAVGSMMLTISSCTPGIPPGTTLWTRCDATDTWLVVEGDVGSAGVAVPGLVGLLRAWPATAVAPVAGLSTITEAIAEAEEAAVFEARPLPPPRTDLAEISELVAALGRLGAPDRILVGGALTMDEVSSWTRLEEPGPLAVRPLRRVEVPTVVVSPGVPRRLVWALPPHRPADEPVLAWLSAWWSGMDGVFFRELREDRGDSYVVDATIVRDPVRGVFVKARGSSPQKLLAVAAIEPTEEDFARVRDVAVRRLSLGPTWREAASEHATWRRLGFPDGDRDAAVFAGLQSLRREDVLAYLARAGRPLVGTPALSAAEEAALRASGAVIERRAAVVTLPGR